MAKHSSIDGSESEEDLFVPAPKRRGRPPKSPGSFDLSHLAKVQRPVNGTMGPPHRRGTNHQVGDHDPYSVLLPHPDGRRPRKEPNARVAAIPADRPQAVLPAKRHAEHPLSAPQKKKKALQCFSDPKAKRVEIQVGETSQVFTIYLDLITSRSSFFKDAFESQAASEGESKLLILKEIDVQVFGLFVQWLYTDALERDGTELTILELAKLWTYAGAWKVEDLQKATMELLISMLQGQKDVLPADNNNVLRQFITYAYSAHGYNNLKRVAVHKMMCCIPSNNNISEWVRSLPMAMQTDLTCEIIKQLPKEFRFPNLKHRNMYKVAIKNEIDLTQ
ncbi:hypothetical protein VTL71DRAFT_1331 [Oculimacula yallundae]|uniref:BTB domain-containing protein n=1 Tax=Oculimacula yallundae TaxID=86028 RepID=A0ABR4CAD6_9HELO